ncbi:hypothetical protein MTO96_015177 [Rhipicephalus appendiculatus]
MNLLSTRLVASCLVMSATLLLLNFARAIGRSCPPGELYLACASRDCAEQTCGRMTRPENCTIECVSGCFCAQRRYRNKKGRCVTFGECLEER